ncbi:MAG: 30S ribosomal protein S3 [Cyanobacteria bacterium P01_A01_bin.68]
MGQKVHPKVLRIGRNTTWSSIWYKNDKYSQTFIEDLQIRKIVRQNLANASISDIRIERLSDNIFLYIHTAKPGFVIGKKGEGIDVLKSKLSKMFKKSVQINVIEIKKPEIDARLVADSIAMQIKKRVSFRRAMKRAIQSAMRYGAKGIRVNCSGRLSGAEIARMEWYKEGQIPLHTLRADIDYAVARSNTTYGVIGVKVWIYKGEKTFN